MEVVDRLQMDDEHLSELASTATASSDYRQEREKREKIEREGEGEKLTHSQSPEEAAVFC